MWTCYGIALIPFFAGAVLWIASRRITFGEWMRGSLISLVVAAGFHFYAVKFPALDVYMRSGKVINAVHRPERQTRQQKGSKKVHRYDEAWFVTLGVGSGKERVAISKEQFEDYRRQFGATELVTTPVEGDFIGDRNNYVALNHNNVFIPAYTMHPFANRSKIEQNVHSFGEPPADALLFDHPATVSKAKLLAYFAAQTFALNDPSECIPVGLQFFDWRKSKRLLGSAAKHYTIQKWERLNGELGPDKDINLIMIGFDGKSESAHWQEAKWLGGKKNDLVLCYGPAASSGKPAWTYCFGPTDDELVKRNLESLLLNNTPGDGLLLQIKSEIKARYRSKEVSSPGYFDTPPPPYAIPILIFIMIVVQGGYWLWAYTNKKGRVAIGEAELQDVADEESLEWANMREQSVKERIATRLAHLRDPTDASELTRELLSGKEPYTAVLALQRCGRPAAITGLVLAMSSEDYQVRDLAADWLDDNASPSSPEATAAVPTLVERLSHEDPEVRRAARIVLDKIDPQWLKAPDARNAVSSMLQAIRSGEAADSVIDGLGARGGAVVDSLLTIFDEGEPVGRIAAIRALGRTRSRRVVPMLLKCLDQADEALCSAAIDGLAFFGPTLRDAVGNLPAYELMHAVFQRSPRPVQLQLIEAFAWLGDERAVDIIAPFLEKENWPVKSMVARALGNLGAPKVLSYLLACAEDIDDMASADAILAIGDIGDDSTADRILDILQRHPDAGSRYMNACIRVLALVETAAARRFIEKIACDNTNEFSELARMLVNRHKSGRPQPEWSRKQRPAPRHSSG